MKVATKSNQHCTPRFLLKTRLRFNRKAWPVKGSCKKPNAQ